MSAAEYPVKILSRTLSVTVAPGEGNAVLTAASDIEQRLGQFKSAYGIQDEGYLLSMCCLQLALELQQARSAEHRGHTELAARIQEMETHVQQTLAALGV